MSHVRTIRPHDALAEEIGASILELTSKIWPPAEGAGPPNVEEALKSWRAQSTAHFIVAEGAVAEGEAGRERVLAHAAMFRREIFTTRGPLIVGALAAVCVHPDFRGRGWGADVVRAAWQYLPDIGAGASLFQTGVPEFYEKLGARLIHNRFVDVSGPTRPFWDKCAMVYPATFAWPDGDIDLNGPGY